jgi:hypothetical protein
MKLLRYLTIVATLYASPVFAANEPAVQPVNLKDATLAVYQGKQVCEYTTHETGFGPWPEWGCKFKSRFTCTATVIAADGEGRYIGLTAGHCFDWEKENEYYISSQISQTPVLKKIKLRKFENDERYDFAIFEFKSLNVYPVVPVGGDVIPEPGTVVTNVNFALGLVKQQTEGKVVSGVIITPAIKVLEYTKGRYLVNIGLGPGASGSAVVVDGKIVGLVEAIFPETQMPTVVIPTGQTFLNFMEDDSAGIKPLPEPKKSDNPKVSPEEEHAFSDWFKKFLYILSYCW